jgi:hypothetical protein
MRDYKAMAAKDVTPTMAAFAEWLQAETGYEVDVKSVALAGSLRMDFQKSDFWKAHENNYLANIEANRETKAIERANAAKARAAKAVEAAKKAEAKAVEAAKAAKAKADALAKASAE